MDRMLDISSKFTRSLERQMEDLALAGRARLPQPTPVQPVVPGLGPWQQFSSAPMPGPRGQFERPPAGGYGMEGLANYEMPSGAAPGHFGPSSATQGK